MFVMMIAAALIMLLGQVNLMLALQVTAFALFVLLVWTIAETINQAQDRDNGPPKE